MFRQGLTHYEVVNARSEARQAAGAQAAGAQPSGAWGAVRSSVADAGTHDEFPGPRAGQ